MWWHVHMQFIVHENTLQSSHNYENRLHSPKYSDLPWRLVSICWREIQLFSIFHSNLKFSRNLNTWSWCCKSTILSCTFHFGISPGRRPCLECDPPPTRHLCHSKLALKDAPSTEGPTEHHGEILAWAERTWLVCVWIYGVLAMLGNSHVIQDGWCLFHWGYLRIHQPPVESLFCWVALLSPDFVASV